MSIWGVFSLIEAQLYQLFISYTLQIDLVKQWTQQIIIELSWTQIRAHLHSQGISIYVLVEQVSAPIFPQSAIPETVRWQIYDT